MKLEGETKRVNILSFLHSTEYALFLLVLALLLLISMFAWITFF